MINVMVVDDHAVVRQGLKALLEIGDTYRVVAEACSCAEAIERARQESPDLIIMDVRLPDRSGIEACREIRSERPETRVLMLTSYPDEQAKLASIMAGAAGYILKDLDENALLDSVDIVARGGSLLSPEMVSQLMAGMARSSRERDPLHDLTDQEHQILLHLADGKTNREIAASLYLSENTIRNYVSTLLHKLGLHRRTEAAAYAVRRGLTRSR